jgi:mono/diheme cytochrome c family protein
MRHYSLYNKITGITVICLFSIFSLLGGYAMAKDDISPREQVFLLTVKKTYEYYCSPCHGFKGKGDGTFFTIDLKPKPRNFTDVKYMQKRTDNQLLKSINEGSRAVDKSNLCPPWGKTIPEKRIKELVAYIRTFSAQEAEVTVVAAKEAVVKEEKSGSFKTSMRWLFLIIITVALAYGAIGEWKKLKKEAS